MSRYTKLLESQLAQTRKDLEFYRGKCERLELRLTGTTPPEPEAKPIEAVEVQTPEEPRRMSWVETVSWWSKLSAKEQEDLTKGGVQ